MCPPFRGGRGTDESGVRVSERGRTGDFNFKSFCPW
nr:MAG TPA: hypothetical protein [Caudoviricetes sp.]